MMEGRGTIRRGRTGDKVGARAGEGLDNLISVSKHLTGAGDSGTMRRVRQTFVRGAIGSRPVLFDVRSVDAHG